MGYTIPTVEPVELAAGDTWQWKKSLSNFSYADGWRLTYALRGSGKIDFDADVDSDGVTHLVNVDAATTAVYGPGDYGWVSYITKGSERHEVSKGGIKVRPNFADASGASVETRSFAKQMVDAIEKVMAGRATEKDAQYTVGGVSGNRSITKLTPLELRTEWGYWKNLYRQELIQSGQLRPATIGVTFINPSHCGGDPRFFRR